MKILNLEQLDERELHVRNQILVRGFMILSGLLLADEFAAFFLRQQLPQGARGVLSGIVCVAIVFAIVGVELAIRNVQFGRRPSPRMKLMITLTFAAIMTGSFIFHLVWESGESFFDYGQLSARGSAIIASSLFAAAALSMAAREIYNMRKQKQITQEETT
ncbi:MAG: hypothetical protein FWD06_04185 [Oscillospiraceae bacterium]|nr:hypothetical protein [Oscillospiraceae bacterium]